MAKAFGCLFLWALRERLCHSIWLFYLYYAENIAFFSNFPADGLHDWGILLVTPLEFQEIKYQPFPMAQPREKASTMFYGTDFFIIY